MISELEAWAIEDMIRHTWMDEGRPVGKGLLLKVFTLVHEFEARRNDESPPAELPLVLTEDELWAIDFHIRDRPVGKGLLLKVFTLVHEFEARRNDESPPAELPLVLTEDELWAIDFHI